MYNSGEPIIDMPPGAYQGPMGIWVVPRDEFAQHYFTLLPGEHLLFAGPTQRGKTRLIMRLAKYNATEDYPWYVMLSKPRDPETERAARQLEFRTTAVWPPKASITDFTRDKPRGYVIKPKFGDLRQDRENVANVFRELIHDRYRKAAVKGEKGLLVADDMPHKSIILGLDEEMTDITTMAGALDLGLAGAVQKPTSAGRTSLWLYGACEHAFIFSDPDRKNRQRYDEIGGLDPKLLERVTMEISPYQCVYVKRSGGYMCIVDKD